MIGTLAQIITLTAYGNDYLRNGTIPLGFDHYAAFQFCNKVDFSEFGNVHPTSALGEKVVSDSPAGWFRHLKADGCKHLRLCYEGSKDQGLEDHKLAGLIGGSGNWFIEAVYDDYSNYWANRWIATDKDAADRKIWTVNYGMLGVRQPTSDLQIDNQTVKDELRHALSEIADFALKQNLQYWAEQFDRPLIFLDSDLPEENFYHQNLIPFDNYSLIAKQILFSACSAWVFGGMGSWNDLKFDDKTDNNTYDELSEQLHSKIIEAIIAGINTY
jgi:hypothetical protein